MGKPVLILMAAGMGSRYGGQKQTDPIGPNGQMLMDYSLYDAKRAGFERVLFVISQGMKDQGFEEAMQQRLGRHFEVRCAVQRLEDVPEGFIIPQGRNKPWGTGHAVRACRGMVDAPFAVINADDYYGQGAFAAIYDFLARLSSEWQRPLPCAMVGYELLKTLSDTGFVSRGICQLDENHRLTGVKEHTHIINTVDGALTTQDGQTYQLLPQDALVSLNIWGFPQGFMDALDARFDRFLRDTLPSNPLKGEYFLPDVVGGMLGTGEATVDVLPCAERWFGVTYQEDRPMVVEAIAGLTAAGQYPQNLWA